MARMKVMGGGATCKCTPGGYVWLVIGVIVLAQIPGLTDLAGIALVVIGVAIHKPAPQPTSEVALTA